MKSILSGGMVAAFVLTAAPALAGTQWQLDAAHSDVAFKVRHLAVSNVSGKFKALKGTLLLDESRLSRSKIDVEFDVASISTDNDQRDGHLRSPDFFDVKKHPKARFVSKRVSKSGRGWKIQGNLTIKGVTRPITLKVGEVSPEVKGPYGYMRKGFSATAELDRRDFGLTWSKTLETGGLVVGHKIKIAIEAEFMRKP